MIVDQLARSGRYFGLGGNIRDALVYLTDTDFTGMEPGRYEIAPDRLYAIVQRYETVPPAGTKWESHRDYIDIQYMVSGCERMGVARAADMRVVREYAETSDLIVYAGEGDFIKVDEGYFALLFPEDVHMPKVEFPSSPGREVTKVVIKVRVE